jgi:7,8-dihydroneopterin aldolase/epimerase/oxygenase
VSGDRIRLTGLRAFGHHGVFPEERTAGQVFVIDLALTLPLAEAARTGDLAATVHYGELAAAVVADVERDPVDLLETVAERLAALVLQNPLVESVEVTVHKPHAPITVPFDDVSVTVTRGRSAG